MISTLCRGGGFFINDIVGAHEGWNQGRMKVSTAPRAEPVGELRGL